jgi:acylphosphatase
MKFLKRLVCMMMIVSFMAGGTVFMQNQAMAASKEPKQVKISGTVQNSPDGIIIMSEGKQYRVEGQDLSNMKGKMVTAKGTVTEEGGKRVIIITSFAEK